MNEMWAAESSPWIKYPLSGWKSVIGGRTPSLYKKKSVIYNQGDAVPYAYIVSSGRVRISTFSTEGVEKQLFIAEQGCLFGEIACIMGFKHFDFATCICDSYIYRIPQAELIDAIRDDWDFNLRVYNSVFRKNIVFRNQILELSFSSSMVRIVRLLLNLCKQYGIGADDSYLLNISFTHQDIAGMVNTSRVTVNTAFTWLLKNDYLRKEARYYRIVSRERLKKLIAEEEKPPEHPA